ncbi:MAG: hypothetical protein IT462_03850 [Planctomycetes bacterium]|nr:hypothetical protein [Planctomycetota bacterium]
MQDHKVQIDIRFPDGHAPDFCEVMRDGAWERIDFNDCEKIFGVPGLYEEIFHRRVDWQSHARVSWLLDNTLKQFNDRPQNLRVLELGAGNGVVGERMRELGIRALAGLDASSSARDAAHRDRPGLYDEYFVAEDGGISPRQTSAIQAFEPNCLLAVASIGCRHARAATLEAVTSLLPAGAWLVVNAGYEWSDGGMNYATVLKEMAARNLVEINSYSIYSQEDGRPYAVMAAHKRAPQVRPVTERLVAQAG